MMDRGLICESRCIYRCINVLKNIVMREQNDVWEDDGWVCGWMEDEIVEVDVFVDLSIYLKKCWCMSSWISGRMIYGYTEDQDFL